MNPPEVTVDAMANPHSHLRESDDPPVFGSLISAVIDGGVDVVGPMPNTKIPLTNVGRVLAYVGRAEELVPHGKSLEFLPIAQITEETNLEEIMNCVSGGVSDFKVYPRYRTTKSEHGVVRYHGIVELIRVAAEIVQERFGFRIRVHLHPEHPSMEFYNRDAEFLFLPIAYMLVEETKATVIWEHGTDARCIPHWKRLAKTGSFYVTLTAHHLLTNEDRTFGDVRSVCKPPIKTENDRERLVELVSEDYIWVMAGADDAPHDLGAKHVHEGQCACGAYTAPFLLPLYAHALDGLLTKGDGGARIFKNFTSSNSRILYDFPPASRQIKLVRCPFKIPASYSLGTWTVEPFWANREIVWRFA